MLNEKSRQHSQKKKKIISANSTEIAVDVLFILN